MIYEIWPKITSWSHWKPLGMFSLMLIRTLSLAFFIGISSALIDDLFFNLLFQYGHFIPSPTDRICLIALTILMIMPLVYFIKHEYMINYYRKYSGDTHDVRY